MPEVAGQAALTVPPTDVHALSGAIKRVLADHELKAKLVAKGRQRALQFSWEKSALKLRCLFEQVGAE